MSWIKSYVEINKHPKVLNLAVMMGWSVRETVGALHIFWHWCVDYAEDGDLRRYNDTVIGSVVALNPDDGRRFVEALVHCGGEVASGFIDREPYFRVHDWWDYIGEYLKSKYRHNPSKWRKIQKAYLTPSKTRQRHVFALSKSSSLNSLSSKSGDVGGGGEGGLESDFLVFWTQYPNRNASKKKAFEAWAKIKPNVALRAAILDALTAQKTWREKRDPKLFTPEWPHPSTWLNQRRWEAELSEDSLGDSTEATIRRVARRMGLE